MFSSPSSPCLPPLVWGENPQIPRRRPSRGANPTNIVNITHHYMFTRSILVVFPLLAGFLECVCVCVKNCQSTSYPLNSRHQLDSVSRIQPHTFDMTCAAQWEITHVCVRLHASSVGETTSFFFCNLIENSWKISDRMIREKCDTVWKRVTLLSRFM